MSNQESSDLIERITGKISPDSNTKYSASIVAMLHEYEHLRREIIQSIQTQHRIVLSESFIVGLLYLLKTVGEYERILRVLVAALPIIMTVLTAIWVAEQSRIMRAGDYLHCLEIKLNNEFGDKYLLWENWLRSGEVSRNHNTHNFALLVGYVGFFGILGYLSLQLYLEVLPHGGLWLPTDGFNQVVPASTQLGDGILNLEYYLIKESLLGVLPELYFYGCAVMLTVLIFLSAKTIRHRPADVFTWTGGLLKNAVTKIGYLLKDHNPNRVTDGFFKWEDEKEVLEDINQRIEEEE